VKRVLLAASVALALSGCAAALQNATTQTPVQVATFAQAETALAVALHGTAAWVRAAHPTAATLTKIETIEARMKADVAQLRADRAAGKPLTFSALNVALAELATAQGGN